MILWLNTVRGKGDNAKGEVNTSGVNAPNTKSKIHSEHWLSLLETLGASGFELSGRHMSQ